MSITDELRGWMKGSTLSSWTAEHLTAIADRIDAEHEAVLADARKAVYQDYVKLPVDADGVPIRVGDVLEVVYLDGTVGKPFKVHSILLEANEWFVSVQNGSHSYASRCRHYHAPTVEDVLREFAYGLGVPVADSYVAACAAKLQLAGDAE